MIGPDRRVLAGVALTILACLACTDESTAPAVGAPPVPALSVWGGDDDAVGVSEFLATTNRQAAAAGARVAAAHAELLTSSDAPLKTPRLVFANDRTLRLESRWVPQDIRRLATDASLSYGVFTPFAKATVGGPSEAAFDASFATWNAVNCSKLSVRKRTLSPAQLPSFILTGLFPPADINDVGFLPGGLFDLVFGTGSSQFTIGVTITFVFIQVGPNGQPILDANGNTIPTDVDGDGRSDTAFKEVWFNDALQYSTTGAAGRIDIESAALHEHGHTLELGHFGKIVGDPKTGKLQVSPRAVMNAVNLGVQRSLLGTDNAGICGNYASWN
jgi:hypothetical protein